MMTRPIELAGLACAALLLLLTAPTAAAGNQCMGVSAHGECTETGVRWCADDGTIKEVECGEGEICAKHEAYDGGYGCVDKELTACAGIPDAGSCTTANALVWCNYRGEVVVEDCANDEICAFDESQGYMECLPASEVHEPSASPEPDPEGSGEDPGEPEPPEDPEDPVDEPDPRTDPDKDDQNGEDPPSGYNGGGPVPTIEQGEEQDLSAAGGGMEGCSSATGDTAAWLVALALLALLLNTRRRQPGRIRIRRQRRH